jgi:UDP-perosamine 4-acetyltransferase
VFVAGTGSFAAEISDWARAAGLTVRGLIEMLDDDRIGQVRHGLPVVGLDPPGPEALAVLGLGGDRQQAWGQLAEPGWAGVAVVHTAASLAHDVRLAEGVTIGPRAVIGAASTVGAQVIVSRGVLVGHHVAVGSFATLNPGVNVGGNSAIGAGAFVGMGATVSNGVAVGERAVIAAGAVVLRDVDAATRVQGVPARAVATGIR